MAAGKTHTTSKKWVDSMGRDKQEEDGWKGKGGAVDRDQQCINTKSQLVV